MKSVSDQLLAIIDQHLPSLKSIPGELYSAKPSPDKWSKKEILGHLVDSAENNIRRFIIAQYEENPRIIYNQDRWVAINNYAQWDHSQLIQLWYLLNLQVCIILRTASPSAAQRNCETQSMHTLEWLAKDYVKHLLHHLHVILELEPVAYP